MYSGTHAMLVACVCMVVAREMLRWPPAQVQVVGQAALSMNIAMTELQDQLAQQKPPPDKHQLADIQQHPHRGRDILPFLEVADALLDGGDAVVLKLHTKRSPHREDGDAWRRDLVASLTDPHAVQEAIRELGRPGADVGLVGPRGHVVCAEQHVGGNAATLAYLRARLGLEGPAPKQFFAGSMFITTLHALRPLLDAHLGRWEFEPEAGQLDGTMAHAIERVITACVEAQGLRWIESPPPAGGTGGDQAGPDQPRPKSQE